MGRGQSSVWAQLRWNQKRKNFLGWEGKHSHLCLLSGFPQKKSNFSPIFGTESSFTTWREASVEGRLPPPRRGGEVIFTFQRVGSQVPEKDTPSSNTGKGLLNKMFSCISKTEKKFTWQVF